MEERVIGGEISEFDERFEQSLRPQFLSQYIGQQKVKHNFHQSGENAPGKP
jgi:Holliday junction DNA helicase RuvB